ncbi:hypothetical protein LXL04_029891 [Taraxacum kok-saghyz]
MKLRSKKRYGEISPCSSSTRPEKKRITTALKKSNPKTKRRQRSTMTDPFTALFCGLQKHLDKSTPRVKLKCNPTASSSPKSFHSGSVSNWENWYLSLCVAMAKLREQKFLTLPEVTRMENLPSGLFQNEATARVFLHEKRLHERVAMIKEIFDAANAV